MRNNCLPCCVSLDFIIGLPISYKFISYLTKIREVCEMRNRLLVWAKIVFLWKKTCLLSITISYKTCQLREILGVTEVDPQFHICIDIGYSPRLLGATSIKCLGLEDTNGQLKLEGMLYLVFVFIPFTMRRHHFIGNLGEVAPFYW